MKKLKDLITESSFKVGNNIIETTILGITITADNQDTFDKTRAGHNLAISLFSIEQFDMLWKLSDKIRDLFMKHFRQIYDRPKVSIENKRRLTVTSPGTLGGINWLLPRFKRFVSDLEVLIKEYIKKQENDLKSESDFLRGMVFYNQKRHNFNISIIPEGVGTYDKLSIKFSTQLQRAEINKIFDELHQPLKQLQRKYHLMIGEFSDNWNSIILHINDTGKLSLEQVAKQVYKLLNNKKYS